MASLPSRTLNRQGGMLAFDEEQEAEGALVSNLEVRRANATKKNDWDAAVDGEVPPLERVPIADSTFFPMSQVAKGVPDMFTSIAKQFNITKGVKALKKTGTLGFTRRMPSVKDHVEGRKDGKPDVFTSFRVEKGDGKFNSHMDNLVASAIKVNQLFENDAYNSNGNEADTYDETQSHSYVFARDDTTEPLLPVTSPGADQYSYSYGSAGSVIGLKRQKKKKRAIESVATSQFWCLPRSRFGLAEILNPVTCMRGMFRFLFASTLPFVILPSVLVASLLYFQMGNPSVEFLPGDASLSWWLIFIARQALVLELVVVVEYLAVEGIALRTKWMVYSCGPLVTLWFINAKGWPLIMILWSLLDLGLLHGEHPFQQNWLYFLDIGVFSSANPGGHILKSDFYLRILLSVLLAGTCHAIKRTHVAMSFGRRTFLNYKTTLEQILADIVLITEVAELTTELQFVDEEHPLSSARRVGGTWKHTLDVNYESTGEANDAIDFVGDFGESLPDANARDADDSLASVDGDDSIDSDDACENDDDDDDDDDEDASSEDGELEDADRHRRGESRTSSAAGVPHAQNAETSTVHTPPEGPNRPGQAAGVPDASIQSVDSIGQLKRLLDRWQEPQNKLDKPADISIAEILKFRKALTYMDDPLLFGAAFGLCATRDQVIKSARKTYRRLLRSTNLSILSYDVIRLLALNEEGHLMEGKDKALKRLFRPDNHRELTLLAFVQTCDTVYKRLRFFRASVGNASVINKVLESIVDGLVNFLLALVVMTILQYNPYPVLVSLSTLMVSFAFAVGSSASKYIEGVLLIAFRRPYDIGDRIVIAQPAQDEAGGTSQSWFVEDINLWCTTLRFAATNEIAVLNNGILSSLRIVNCNRSPNALISFTLDFNLPKVDEEKLKFFREELEHYLRERPRIYEALMVFRCELVDTNRELIQYSVRVRHMRSWQDAPVVLHNRGELLWFSTELGRQLGINKSQVPIQVATVADSTHSNEVVKASDVIAVIAGATTKASNTSGN